MVDSVERYSAYLSDIERSPNTVKAYAHDLKDWFVFLVAGRLDWRQVRLEDVGGFVAGSGCRRWPGLVGWRYCRRWATCR